MNFFGPNGLILDRPGQGFAKKVCRLEYANAWARLLERIIHCPGNLQFLEISPGDFGVYSGLGVLGLLCSLRLFFQQINLKILGNQKMGTKREN